MANAIYPKAKEKFLSGNINMTSDTIRVALIDTGVYTYSASHEFWSSASAGVIGTPQTLGSKTVTNGEFDAGAVTFTAVTGANAEALIIFKDTGTPSDSPLIAYIDSGQTGLPVTPNGGDIVYTPGTNIFAL
jgi:hypothetical protein